jgi:hypothetical protein
MNQAEQCRGGERDEIIGNIGNNIVLNPMYDQNSNPQPMRFLIESSSL